jgi:8-oxo-dGTP pyrophosphatase MutT (NUDIX family)
MGAGELPTVNGRSRTGAHWRTAKSRLSSRVEQVAAVCYRIRGTSIEFLLVRTRKGRWTFPKGGAESGLTYAQAAALEAFEEAGVHGRIEEASFARYRRWKRGNLKESAGDETVVHAYLCEVLRLGPAQELNRNRTWFSAEKTKWQLRESRTSENGGDLARVVDCAVARIERLRSRANVAADTLQKVEFEAREAVEGEGNEDSAAIEFAVNAYVGELMRPSPAQTEKTRLLTTGKMKLRSETGRTPDYVGRFPRVVEGHAGGLQNRKVVQINRPRKTIMKG